MDNEFGMKELYLVQLKSTYPIEIKGKEIAAGETIAAFDKIQIANFHKIHNEVMAQGGYQNRRLVVWDRTEGVDLIFTQGIFSKTQMALMQNAGLLTIEKNQTIAIAQRDLLETDSEGIITLTHEPIDSWIFVYNKETGEKLTGLRRIAKDKIQTPLVYKDVIVDYRYGYNNGADVSFIGEEIFEGVCQMDARSRIKDDVTGKTRTVIIRVPKLKITSGFNLTLGENAQPVVGRFEAKALSIGPEKESKALEMYFLEDDIDKELGWR